MSEEFKLNNVPILSVLSDEEAAEIAPYFEEETHQKRDQIFSEGDPSDWLYIVRTGKVKITKVSQDGKEIILELISAGDFFGGIAVVKGFPYPANAVAMEDVKLLKMPRSKLLKVLEWYPSVMFLMTQHVGERIRESHETLKKVALDRVESRIASLLLKLSEKAGEETDQGLAINMKLTKQDIAEMVGTTVETAIRTMSKFKKTGAVEEKEGRIFITDPDSLLYISGN